MEWALSIGCCTNPWESNCESERGIAQSMTYNARSAINKQMVVGIVPVSGTSYNWLPTQEDDEFPHGDRRSTTRTVALAKLIVQKREAFR